MICQTCRKVEATTSVWSAGWIAIHMPPMQTCRNCAKQHERVGAVIGQDALDRWTMVKQSVIWSDLNFDQLQSEILLNGDIIKGREGYQSKSLTLLSRLAVSYNEDYWIVTKYSLINLGSDTFWINRLNFQ